LTVTFLHSLPRLIADERNIPSAKAEKWAQWLRSQFYFPNLAREQQAFIPYLSEENRADLAELLNNAEKFLQKELNALPAGTMPGTDASLGMRLQAAADYFSPRLEKLATAFLSLIEGQAVDQRVNALTTQANVLLMECSLRHCFFKNILANESFEINRTALRKAVAAFQPKEEKKPTKETVLLHPQLHHKISEWRTEWSRSKGVPEHIILADKTLIAVANKAPRSLDELSAIAGVGPAKARSLGESLLKLIYGHFGARELF
jgi:hypothetical protein